MAIKITKATLKRLLKHNLINRFMLSPERCGYGSGFGIEFTIQDVDDKNGETLERKLQNLINTFDYYNCNKDTGHTSHVFIHDKYRDLLEKKKVKEVKLTKFKEEIK